MTNKIFKHYSLGKETIEQINVIQLLFKQGTSRHIYESEIVMIAINEFFHNLNWQQKPQEAIAKLKTEKWALPSNQGILAGDTNGE